MLGNYLTTALRNITRNKLSFLINTVGVSIGMAACIFILEYVNFEWSYDQFNRNASDLYRVVNDRYQDGKLVQHSTMTYSAIGKALQNDYPEVINHTRVEPLWSRIIMSDETKTGGQNGLAVDPSFFEMFSYPLTVGNSDQVLNEPGEIILSEACARRIFGAKEQFSSMVGRLLKIERNAVPYRITGICKNTPDNSHLQFDFLIPFSSLYSGGNKYWKDADHSFTESYFWHYVQLRSGSDYKALEAKLPSFSQRYFQGNKVSGSNESFYLQPLLKAHLYSDFQSEIGKTGNFVVVWGAFVSAILILAVAWVNYINLTTARSAERAREVGVRKSSGATRAQLVLQFFSESLLSNVISMALAGGLIYFCQTSFNELVRHDLSIFHLFRQGLYGYMVAAVLILVIISGIFIAGIYPALVLSSYKPVVVLTGGSVTSSGGIILRKALVVGQFSVTIALIIGSIIVYQQIKYADHKNLGLNISQVLIVNPPQLSKSDSGFMTRVRSFKDELRKIANVKNVTNSSRIPGDDLPKAFDVHRPDVNSSSRLTMNNVSIGEEFLDLYEIKLLAGRNFLSADYSHDLSKIRNIILNESAMRLLGFSSYSDAVGKSLILHDSKYDIIGVVKDFHQKSLHYPLEALVLMPNYSIHNPISVKVDTRNLTGTISAIKKEYDHFFSGNLFEYHFLDGKFNEQYSADRLIGKIFAIIAGLTVFIASFGLLGLSWHATSRRTKEIGVRKVLGASVHSIIILLSGDFLKLIIIAFIIASPVAWLIMQRWLSSFAYRIHLNLGVFFLAGLLALSVAFITICFQAMKAAAANPVKSLRNE